MEKVEFGDITIANNQAKNQIINALDKIKGVQEVSVDRSNSTVEVEYNEPATEEDILKCLRNTGYKGHERR